MPDFHVFSIVKTHSRCFYYAAPLSPILHSYLMQQAHSCSLTAVSKKSQFGKNVKKSQTGADLDTSSQKWTYLRGDFRRPRSQRKTPDDPRDLNCYSMTLKEDRLALEIRSDDSTYLITLTRWGRAKVVWRIMWFCWPWALPITEAVQHSSP